MSANLNSIRGARFIALASTLILVGVMLTLWSISDPEQAWRAAVRLTARTSALLFLMAFGASAATKLCPGNFTYWLLDNRRYIGLSFAASHTIHAYTFLRLAGLSTEISHQVLPLSMIIVGGVGYCFIFALALTSSNWAQAALGARWWGLLHFVGTHFLWLQLLLGFIKHAPDHPEDWLGVCFMLVFMLMRIAARRQGKVNT